MVGALWIYPPPRSVRDPNAEAALATCPKSTVPCYFVCSSYLQFLFIYHIAHIWKDECISSKDSGTMTIGAEFTSYFFTKPPFIFCIRQSTHDRDSVSRPSDSKERSFVARTTTRGHLWTGVLRWSVSGRKDSRYSSVGCVCVCVHLFLPRVHFATSRTLSSLWPASVVVVVFENLLLAGVFIVLMMLSTIPWLLLWRSEKCIWRWSTLQCFFRLLIASLIWSIAVMTDNDNGVSEELKNGRPLHISVIIFLLKVRFPKTFSVNTISNVTYGFRWFNGKCGCVYWNGHLCSKMICIQKQIWYW